MKRKMSFEEFTKHCNNDDICCCCVYAPKNKRECYNLYCIMYDDVKRKRAIIEANSIYGVIRKEIKDNG